MFLRDGLPVIEKMTVEKPITITTHDNDFAIS